METYFYVRVLAYSRLSNAKLEITGGNIESVEEVDDQTTENPNIVTENLTTTTENSIIITESPTTISPTTLTSISKFSIIHRQIFSLLNNCRETKQIPSRLIANCKYLRPNYDKITAYLLLPMHSAAAYIYGNFFLDFMPIFEKFRLF